MCECFVCMNVCLSQVCLMPLKARRALDPLELELKMVVSHCVGLGTELRSSARAASALTVEPSLQPKHLTVLNEEALVHIIGSPDLIFFIAFQIMYAIFCVIF